VDTKIQPEENPNGLKPSAPTTPVATRPEPGKSSNSIQQLYGREYFEKHCGPIPYTRDEPRWQKFFDGVAEELIRSLKPCTVLDVGCAIGFLVESFWQRGVRAYGIDISEYAISQVPENLRFFCRVLSATQPLPEDFPSTYDLVTCIEVLEHIAEDNARVAIKNMASSARFILFSSTPHDLTEPTHINVRPVIYWLQLFAEVGFYPDLRFDASFVCPHAFLLRKEMPRLEEDALPFFAESIAKKFQITAQQEQIAGLTQSSQELQRRLDDETKENGREIETLRRENALLKEDRHELGETLRLERENQQTLQGQIKLLEPEAVRLRSTIQQQQQVLEQKEAQIELTSVERDKLMQGIAQLRENLSEKEAELLERDSREADLSHDRDQFEMTLSIKEIEIAHREKRIETLELTHSGLFWELLVGYRRTKDRCLPYGTRRRALYDAGLRSVKALRQRGSGPFVDQSQGELKPRAEPFREHSSLPKARERVLRINKFCLLISGCTGDTFRYRCEHQAEQLRFFGLTVDVGYFEQIDYDASLKRYRCFWFHRVPHTERVEKFIHDVKQAGKLVIFDTDDLIFDEERICYIRALQWLPPVEIGLYYDGVRRYHRTLSLFEYATVTTEPLRGAVLKVFPDIRCFVNPNVLSDAQLVQAEEALKLEVPPDDQRIVRIAYFSGTRTHNVDFRECSKALERILDSYANVHLMVVGHLDMGDEFNRFGARVKRCPLVRWQDLPKLFRNVDINLAPLEINNPFTESKSDLKYFEAAALGVPTVASDIAPYQESIRHGENGYLCQTEDDWYRCLARLIEEPDLRGEMGSQARKDVFEKCTTRRSAANLIGVVREIAHSRPWKSNNLLSVVFILRAPIAQVGGGYKNIFRLAHYLARQGHDVHLYIEPNDHLEGKSEAEIVRFCHRHFGETPARIHVGHDSIADCDVAIATNWPTAFVVDKLTNAICKLYLIQDFEPDFYEYQSPLYREAEKTYALALRKVTLGRYLAGRFEDKEQLTIANIDFALDPDVFNTRRRDDSHGPLRLLFFARPSLRRRGFDVGIEALKRVYQECPDTEIYLYGMANQGALPFPCTHLGVLDPERLADAMQKADIHLSFSLTNISYVPFEAMACGCAVVEAKVPSVEAMVKDGDHCLLAEPEPDKVAQALLRLVKDKDLRERMVKAGLDVVRNKTWDNSCKQFEDILFDSLLVERNLNGEQDSGCDPSKQHQKGAGSREHLSFLSPSAEGVFYRCCNFCGGKQYRVFKRIDIPFPDRIYSDRGLTFPDVGRHLKLQYLECLGCGLVGINPLTRFSDISRNSFDGERNIVAWADLDYAWYEADKLKQTCIVYDQYELETFRHSNRVLDVSCGPGVSLKWLRDEKRWEVFGIDPDRYAAKVAWERYRLRIKTGLIHDLKVPAEYFDLIIIDNSLEHTFDPLSTLLRAWRLLRKGGGLFIATPNCHGLSTQFLNDNVHWGHWFLYSPEVVCKILSRIGYKVSILYAIQNPVNPILVEKGLNLDPYREGLAVSLVGNETVTAQIGKAPIYSDYFNLMALKPPDWVPPARFEEQLTGIAQASIEELTEVTII
jgi:glycosyltransferase involved in cell wall biosynthesis/2-polyprenyl-3-methyl-5-hydroxy-6-metoxy-1,4-benzoquinol methylase